MIVRDIKDLKGTQREVKGEGWTSTRLLLKKDNMGFSMHETIIPKNTELKLHYQNHLEAVYCISGKGKITNLDDGKEYDIHAGIIYALDNHDRHILVSFDEELRLVCVFNPPVTGEEKHDKNGSYPTDADYNNGIK
ncbi:MAG: ectoine synthase [Proteobacteria bacterium]|nr:ectoine synthase [Pseudomonadota bacterium]